MNPPPYLDVTLSYIEQQENAVAAKARFVRRKDSKHLFNRPDDEPETLPMTIDHIGAEQATAKAIGTKWVDSPLPDKQGDIGPGLQVRHTYRETDGRLILHLPEYDAGDHVFFLVTGRMPTFRVHGWITAQEGRLFASWENHTPPPKDPRWCYYLARHHLYSMSDFALPPQFFTKPPMDLPPGFWLDYPAIADARAHWRNLRNLP